jgi:hypothetical protein
MHETLVTWFTSATDRKATESQVRSRVAPAVSERGARRLCNLLRRKDGGILVGTTNSKLTWCRYLHSSSIDKVVTRSIAIHEAGGYDDQSSDAG